MKNKECYARYMCRNEKVSASKLFFNILNIANSETAKDYAVSYSYLRKLDNIVDSGRNPELASRVISIQKSRIEKLIENKDIGKEKNSPLPYLKEKYGNRVLETFLEFIGGFEIDNRIIKEGMPPKEETLKKRNLLLLLPTFKAFSLVAFNKELEYSRNFEDLMHTWGRYDALVDLEEDFRTGIILFSQEELEKNSIELRKGLKVPENFENFFYSSKKDTLNELQQRARYSKETNLPLTAKFMIQGYFESRKRKLSKQEYPFKKDLVIGKKN